MNSNEFIDKIKEKFYIADIVEYYKIPINELMTEYKKNKNEDIESFVLGYIENVLRKNNRFVGRIDYYYASCEIGEILYFFDKKNYNKEINDSYNIGRPISSRIIKDKENKLELERSLF